MNLERAKVTALSMLASIPDDGELSLTRVEDQEVWLGIGYCTAKGWATYMGSNCFQITSAGHIALVTHQE